MLISKKDWRVSAVSDSTLSISLFLVSGHVRRGAGREVAADPADSSLVT